ncbi:hypothetical protein LSAT2_022691 [Lamellibrachia satsuma]|nr:hypothetical protein LSAT2_022691 [Lamellibrachia satsuma]
MISPAARHCAGTALVRVRPVDGETKMPMRRRLCRSRVRREGVCETYARQKKTRKGRRKKQLESVGGLFIDPPESILRASSLASRHSCSTLTRCSNRRWRQFLTSGARTQQSQHSFLRQLAIFTGNQDVPGSIQKLEAGFWPELVGQTWFEAENVIRRQFPNITVQVLPVSTCIQKKFSPNRVKIFVNAEGRVVRVPKIG